MKCYTFEGNTLTEKELYENIRTKLQHDPNFQNLKYAIFNIQEDINKLIDKAGEGYNAPNSVGTSEFIDLEHELVQSDGTIIMQHLSPAYDRENRIKNSIQKLLSDSSRPDITTAEEARKEIELQMAEEDGISDFGSLMHELFSITIKARIDHNTPGTSSTEFQDALNKAIDTIQNSKEYTDKEGIHHAALMDVLTKKVAGGVTISDIRNIIKTTCERVEGSIFNGRNPKTIYKSEYKIATSEVIGERRDSKGNIIKNVRGICDLLIVNPNGEVEIVDFKVASRPYADWYAAKQAHTDYQLATYRQILAANGIDGSKVQLKAFPIYFPLGKITSMDVGDIQNRTAMNISSPSRNLDWGSGIYTKKIKQLIGTKIVPLEYDNITLNTDIQDHIKSLLGKYDLSESQMNKATRDEIIKSIWASQNGTETFYNVIDRITGQKFSSRNKDQVIKYIDSMMPKMDKMYSQQIKTLVDEIKQFQAKNDTTKTEFDLLNSSKNSNVNVFNVLNGVFSKFCNANYNLIEVPELLDLGIFIFQNKNSGLIDVVRVSDKNIRTEISICGNSTVLGKYVSNAQAQQMTTIRPMKASVGNIQLIETMSALNDVASVLQYGRIASINIINPHLGQRDIADMNTLKQNFNYLTSKSNIENKFNSILSTASTWEVMQDSIQDIVANPTIDPILRQVVSNLEQDQYNVQQKIELIESCMQKLENTYSQLRHKSFLEKRSFDTPQEKVYLILSLALLHYKNTSVQYDGKLSQWGLHFEEIIRLLGCPFLSQYKGTLNNGFKAVGFLQGLDMSTPNSIPSKNLSALYQYWSSSFQHIRSFTLQQTNYLNKITQDYYQRHGVSNLSRAVLNSSTVWEDFIEKGQDNKFTKELKIINPNTLHNTQDQLFLNQMLWEIQKFIIPGISEEQKKWRYEDHKTEINNLASVIEAKSSGKYYYLPLRRATNFDRMRHVRDSGGLFAGMKRYWESLESEYDPRQLHTSAQKIISSEFGEVTEMYNQYKISERARNQIIEKETQFDFETDLNLLAIDVAFQSKRKELFDECLTHAAAMATVFHYLNETSDANFDAELQNLDDETKVILKNESPISKELKDVSKGIGALKRLNSLIVLGCRPFQFIKEITYGQFTNFSRVQALKGTGQEISAKSVFQANKYVWGTQIASWMRTITGNEDVAAFTMTQLLNKTYGIANEDLNRISITNSMSRTGVKHGLSKYMYIFSSCPDFFNRMSLFIAKMIEDGSFDAHSVDKDGNLVYNIKKDKRFSKLVKLGLNAKSTDKEYLEQRSLYRAMVNQFIQEGYKKPDGSQLNPFDENLYMPKALTNKETMSLKEVSDQAYGYYDHEAKSLNDHKFFGMVFKQFMAFWTAKVNLWIKAPGSNTARGHFENMMEGDKQVYVKYVEDPVTGEITTEFTTENPDGTLEPAKVWKGEYVEGLWFSIMYTLRDFFTGHWSEMVGNKQRIGQFKLAMHDILIGIILYNIIRLIFSGGSGKMKDMNAIEKTLVRSMQDVGPQAIWGLSITPSFVQMCENLKTDLPSLLSEDPDVAGFIQKRIGAVKDITWAAE